MTLSKKLKPFMTYLDDHDYVKLKKFAKAKRVTMARILREGLEVRMAQDNPYLKGFNDGLTAATKVVNEHQASQMQSYSLPLPHPERLRGDLLQSYRL